MRDSPHVPTPEAMCPPHRLGYHSYPPPQQVLTVNWAWPGRDNRGQSTRSVPMETSAQDEELRERKKKKKRRKTPCKGHEGNKKDKSDGASWWAGQTAPQRR